MSNLVTMAFQTVEVTWTEGNKWSFQPNALVVRDQNLTVFVYTLTPESTPGVTFAPKEPVLWDEPSTQPPNLGLALLGKSADLYMTDLNTATRDKPEESYRFFLQVEFGGAVYTSPDPTIVNTEPPHIDFNVVEEVSERTTLAA
ncbi:MAG TPA: hypothetical protein VJ725_13355 [Thermoanaerobaculia bacterium]|nr:hypothetical protein [Thermoanaerobaculia bacterium]